MMKSRLLSFVCICVFLLFSSPSKAALISAFGGQAVYDTTQDITWLTDANYAKTSGYDADGLMSWSAANAWASSLTIGGVITWRLPTTQQPDPTCSVQQAGGTISSTYNCTGSEMGHLYNVDGIGTNTPGLFSNIQVNNYWSSTQFSLFTVDAWFHDFKSSSGVQGEFTKTASYAAWAVADGDVFNASVVPIPPALWLFGSGLLGLVCMAKRNKVITNC